jgi:hexosaminidase
LDRPQFPWREKMLDVSRHFFKKELIRTFIDVLALHRMNTSHWHLTDDQGWRIEFLWMRLLSISSPLREITCISLKEISI